MTSQSEQAALLACNHDASYGNGDGTRTCILTGCGVVFTAPPPVPMASADYRYEWPGALTTEQQERVYALASAFHQDEACDCYPILSDCMDQAIDRLLAEQAGASSPAE